MKINYKTGILLAMLALPVFIWLFLKFFGHNRYDIPIFYGDGVVLKDCPAATDSTHTIPAFSLKQTNGQPFTETKLNQHVSVVYLFSSPCDTACTKVMEAFARIQHVFEEDSVVQLLSIADTEAAKIAQLADRYRALPDKWFHLSGEKSSVETLKRCGFVLHEQDMQSPILLLDTERRIRGYYAGLDEAEIDRLVLEIRILLYNLKENA